MLRCLAFLMLLAAPAAAQTIPQLKLTLEYNNTLDSANLWQNREPFALNIQNIDSVPVTINTPFVGYADGDDPHLPVFFKTYYWDNDKLVSFNNHCTDIDIVLNPEDPDAHPVSTLQPGQTIQLKCNPFFYSCTVDGKKEYRVKAYYWIEAGTGVIFYHSNAINLTIE